MKIVQTIFQIYLTLKTSHPFSLRFNEVTFNLLLSQFDLFINYTPMIYPKKTFKIISLSSDNHVK